MRVAEKGLTGNNGCYFERGLSQRGGARKSVDEAAISLPHAAKKRGTHRCNEPTREDYSRCLTTRTSTGRRCCNSQLWHAPGKLRVKP